VVILNNLIFKELNNKEKLFSLNYREKNKNFFIDQIKQVYNILRNYKIFYLENEKEEVLGVFIITFLNQETIQIAFYVLDPSLNENELIEIISNFLDFLEDFARKNRIKQIFAGVDYYNDELFEKMVEKGFVAISYKMVKEIK